MQGLFFDNDIGNSENNNNKYGFKFRNSPPQNKGMEKFEDDVLLMIKNIEFQRVNNDFQSKLKDDIKKTSSKNNALSLLIKLLICTNFQKINMTNYFRII